MYDEEMQSYLVADDVMPRRRQEKGLKRYLLPAETTQQTKKRPLDDLSDHPAFEPSKKVKRSDQLPSEDCLLSVYCHYFTSFCFILK